MRMIHRQLASFAALLAPVILGAQQQNDSAYTARIRELTVVDSRYKFTTEMVDHLPASATVPTPLKVLGYVPGTIGKLSHTADINKYFRALAAASPRTKIFSLGMSDEDREEIVLAIADEETIKRLDDYRAMAARLADPRGMPADERARLVKQAKPIYWVLGSIHSPETGSPEMLMEMAYRLAVEESDRIKGIRANVITLITPVQEVDGRDRMVDVFNQSRAMKTGNLGQNLVYWGKYTAHDNNRDGMVISQKITQNYLKGFLYWRPTITHDLHESVPFLYISTGTGPYNDELDPIVVGEWNTLAYQEMTELTRRGLPGVWTHGFYDGWAPNYVMAITQLHNSLGRFYETYTSSGADCQTVNLGAAQTSKEWFRPSPPVNGVKWCIRSNINYQQSGVLVALKYVADNRETFMENFLAKAQRMIDRGKTSPPYAYVIPRNQRHAAEAADLVNLFRLNAAEVQVATSDFTTTRVAAPVEDRGPAIPGTSGTPRDTTVTKTAVVPDAPATNVVAVPPPRDMAPTLTMPPPARRADSAGAGGGRGRGGAGSASAARDAGPITVHTGDWIVRMDQPYTATVRTVLAIQKYKVDDPSPYDDTGWTIDELRHVTTYAIGDSSVLSKPMQPLGMNVVLDGKTTGTGGILLVRHLGDWRSAVLPWKAGGKVAVADTAFTADGATYPAGTFIIDGAKARDAVKSLGLEATAVASAPQVRSHAISLPRIAYIHTWQETQNEGWVRFALDQLGVPYTYMADQKLKNSAVLDKYDVVLFPHSGQGGLSLVNGRSMAGPAIPWRATASTPHLGKWDETDDMRPGMGLEGAAGLKRFVERGGLLLVEGSTSRLPIELGFTSGVSEFQSRTLGARGAVYRAMPVTKWSPILYGYDDGSPMSVYFNSTPLLAVQEAPRSGAQNDGIDPSILAAQQKMRARVILKFHDKADSLGISGMLNNPGDMLGKAAVIDAPVGNGHVVMFAIRPFWRQETQGSFALAINAIANWNHLDQGELVKAGPVSSTGASPGH